jgi:Fe-S cluster assembly protein SufB
MVATQETLQTLEETGGKYKYGFETDIDMMYAPKGLTEETVRFISAQKNEPLWLLDWRLKAFRIWQNMPDPKWAKLEIP